MFPTTKTKSQPKAEAVQHDERAEALVTKAVAAVVLEDPFYGFLLLRQDIVQDPKVPTASTNGKVLRYNPKFVRELSISQLKGLMKHEVMHCAHSHHIRRGSHDPNKWNEAGDYEINNLLVQAGQSLPPNGLINAAWNDFGIEHIYNLLPDKTGQGPGGDNIFGPPWNWGAVEDAPGAENEDKREELEAEVRQDVINAINAAKVMGKMPVGLERFIGKIQESKLPWKRILARFFRSVAKNDTNWMRPNKRYLASKVILPSLYSEAMGPLVIGVDTSGSMGQEELEKGFGVVNGILKQTKPESIHVIYCDAEVGNVQVFKPKDYPIRADRFKPKGGGGTSFVPVFEYVKEKKLNPCALLYFTDLLGCFPDKPPKYPVLWLATTKSAAPWGRTLEMT